jgi:hypothetical protein
LPNLFQGTIFYACWTKKQHYGGTQAYRQLKLNLFQKIHVIELIIPINGISQEKKFQNISNVSVNRDDLNIEITH